MDLGFDVWLDTFRVWYVNGSSLRRNRSEVGFVGGTASDMPTFILSLCAATAKESLSVIVVRSATCGLKTTVTVP